MIVFVWLAAGARIAIGVIGISSQFAPNAPSSDGGTSYTWLIILSTAVAVAIIGGLTYWYRTASL